MVKKLIGEVGVDSGMLLLTDPCYIDGEWENEDFQDVRIYENKHTKDRLQYMKDFGHYEEVIDRYKKTMNELNATGDWIQLEDTRPVQHNFSYNACCDKTLSKDGHGQLHYKAGHPGVGVAFSTAFGDGVFPVYAEYDKKGDLKRVSVEF